MTDRKVLPGVDHKTATRDDYARIGYLGPFLTYISSRRILNIEMQTVFNGNGASPLALSELREGENGILETLDLPEEFALRLMELGFVPGHSVSAGKTAPGGDPRIFRIDGSEIALRKETCSHILIRAFA